MFSICNMNKLYKELGIRVVSLIGLVAFLIALILKLLGVV
ncbi:hypothetical protein CNEO4_480017 [Clostridium neonatale]|nr:hypothetical protein CNEO3_700016 [Clostridium neonatale]CAI3661955.1 hypothetical protein CNEO4_480017 [Clostridium neonatale]